jgi:hypothetical protein
MSRFVPCRHAAIRVGVIAGLAIASIAAGGTSAVAQAKVDADFAKYCRTHYPNSTPALRGIRHFCNQRGTLQGVDLGEACRLTNGSRRYELDGARVLCLSGPSTGGPRQTAGEPDFQRYCRTKYPNSTYVRRPASRQPGGIAHLCRQPGRVQGYVLHNIDLAAACRQSHGVSGYVIAGNRVVCGLARGSSTRRRYSPACRRVCSAQPSAGARAYCFRHFRLCR